MKLINLMNDQLNLMYNCTSLIFNINFQIYTAAGCNITNFFIN